MGKLIYSGIMSLDGYVADERGEFDWSTPDDDVHAFVNDLERDIGTVLYGRRLYEVMVAWETLGAEGEPAVMRDYATIWRAAEKVVYSTTLESVSSARTRIERRFEPEAIRRLKETEHRNIGIGGPGLAASAVAADLVDEYHLFLSPVVVGGGTPYLPKGVHLDLRLLHERSFSNGVVYLRYASAN